MNTQKVLFVALFTLLCPSLFFSQTIDPDFNFYVRKDASIGDIVVQSDGKILVSGSLDFCDDHISRSIVRFNTDGTADENFSTGAGTSGSIFTIVVQSDGKIIIGGNFAAYDGNPANNLARLNQDGSFDSSFNIGTGFTARVYTLTIDQDDKILVGSATGSFDGVLYKGLLRLNSDGSLDENFVPLNTDGVLISRIDLQSDGKIIVLNRSWGGE